MSAENEKMLRGIYEAFGTGNLDALSDMLTDDAAFHVPGNNILAGDYNKADFFGPLLGKVMEWTAGTFAEQVHDIAASEEHGVGIVTQSFKRDGRDISYRSVHVWHLKDGKASEFWEFPDQPDYDKAWS